MSSLAAHPLARPAAPTARGGVEEHPRRHLRLVGPDFVPVPAPSVPAQVGGRSGTRLTRRGRRVVAGAALVLAATTSALVGAWAGQEAAGPAGGGPLTTVSVAPGDTLWSLASATAGSAQDVRATVDQIVAVNGLGSAELRVGQRLQVPAGGR